MTEHEAKVTEELTALPVADLRRELDTLGLTKIGRKRDLVKRLIPHRLQQRGSPFDLLPDEIVLKIIKMAAWLKKPSGWSTMSMEWNIEWAIAKYGPYCSYYRDSYREDMSSPRIYDYGYIIKDLCMVSTRFSQISRDQSLWQDCFKLIIQVNQLNRVTDWFLHDGIREICLEGHGMDDMNATISGDNIANIALKCPNLKKLEICKAKIDTWPTVCIPSLEVLLMTSPQCGSNMFKNMQLRTSLTSTAEDSSHLQALTNLAA